MVFHLTANLVKDGLFVKSVLRIEPIIGGPVQVMAVLGAQHGTDGMAAKGQQVSQQMSAAALEELWRVKRRGTRIDDVF